MGLLPIVEKALLDELRKKIKPVFHLVESEGNELSPALKQASNGELYYQDVAFLDGDLLPIMPTFKVSTQLVELKRMETMHPLKNDLIIEPKTDYVLRQIPLNIREQVIAFELLLPVGVAPIHKSSVGDKYHVFETIFYKKG